MYYSVAFGDLCYRDTTTIYNDGGLNLDDMEWLCDYDATLQSARDWREQIIIAGFMECEPHI